MAKSPAIWSSNAGSATAVTGGGALLLEDGGYLLLEDGGHLLLEDIDLEPKELSRWTTPTAKAGAAWVNGTASLSNTGVRRVQDNNTVRTLDDGTIRVLDDVVITPKANSSWRE